MDTNNSDPCVSVILPVYNAELYIKEAIDSVLNQTFEDFEFLIFNDASTDGTTSILESYSDSRIKLFSSSENKGYLHYLNLGIVQARGKYIARMDADDICEIERFEKQVNYLNLNDEVGVVGSSVKIFGEDVRIQHYPESSIDCDFYLLYRSCFAHPAVMLRKSILLEHGITYNPEYYTAEDYFMWVQLSSITSFHNIKEVLLKYRVNSGSISITKKKEQFQLKNKIQLYALNEILGIELNQSQNEMYLAMLNPYQKIDINWKIVFEIIEKIRGQSKVSESFTNHFLEKLNNNLSELVNYNIKDGISMVNGYLKFNRKYSDKIDKKHLAKLYLKAFLKR